MAAKEYFSLQKPANRRGGCDLGRGCCACMLFLLIAIIIALLVIGLAFLIMAMARSSSTVETTCGKVRGVYKDKAYAFEGIPYAAPPVGDLRWQRPKALKPAGEEKAEDTEAEPDDRKAAPENGDATTTPAEPIEAEAVSAENGDGGAAPDQCWEGTLKSTSDRDSCVQTKSADGGNLTVTGSEDCLYLDVYSPKIHGKNLSLPVIVFIHDERQSKDYRPTSALASEMNVVFVTPQYRLGPLGFLVLNELGNTDANFGLWDQIEALRWVKENIAAFGGNPDDVTIVGQGRGGTCVMALVASPEAKGLFHRAWVMSGSGTVSITRDSARRSNAFVLGATGCSDGDCLRNISAETITNIVESKWMEEETTDLPIQNILPYARIVVDDAILSDTFVNSMENALGSDVPLMIGSAAQSVDYDPAPGRDLKSWTSAQFVEYLKEHIGDEHMDELLAIYNFSRSKDPECKLTTIISDMRHVCAADVLAEKAAKAFSSPVYRYVVKSYPSSEVNAFGGDYPAKYAFGGWDLYGFLGKVGDDMGLAAEDSDRKFADIVSTAALNFVTKNQPKPGMWNKFPNSTALLRDFLERDGNRYHKEACSFLNDNYLQYRVEY